MCYVGGAQLLTTAREAIAQSPGRVGEARALYSWPSLLITVPIGVHGQYIPLPENYKRSGDVSDERRELTATAPHDRPKREDSSTWSAHWTSQDMPWPTEQEIAAERARFLTTRRAIMPNIAEGVYPFKDVVLSRADVEWLLATHESGGVRGPIEWRDQRQRERAGLDVRGADLHGNDLRGLPLARLHAGVTAQEQFVASTAQAELAAARFDGADLSGAHLEGATLFGACLERVTATGTHFDQALLAHATLEWAFLGQAHLESAILIQSRLQQSFLRQAYLQGAYLREVHLEGADLGRAQLAGANLQRAFFDTATQLDGVSLWDADAGGTRLAGVRWGGADLAGIAWARLPHTGEEQQARRTRTAEGRRKSRATRLREYDEAVRVNRQLAVTLQEQGLTEAARFGYRAQVLQRQVLGCKALAPWARISSRCCSPCWQAMATGFGESRSPTC
jgi:uncharacterized protein YjbI with pentapeptide repeats